MRRLATLMVSCGWLLVALHVASPASASDNPLIAQGVQEYNDLMYEESVNTLSAALMQPGNTADQLIQIYKYLGLNYLLLERPNEASGAFVQLLCIDENWSFDPVSTSPKIVTFFNATRQQWITDGKPGQVLPDQPKVTITHKVPDEGLKGEEIHLKFTVDDPSLKIAAVHVFYKTAEGFIGTKAMPVVTPTKKTDYMCTLPGDVVMPPQVDYYVQAIDIGGEILAARGDADAPLRVTVPSKEGGSVAKKWWFWTIIGVVVAGTAGGIAGGVVSSKKKGGSSTSPAHVTITVCEHGLDCL